jgi:hypothetical protein
MDTGLITVIAAVGMGMFFMVAIFILPLRKLNEEKDKVKLHSEHCTANYSYGALTGGGGIPKRITFYDNFFVVAGSTIAKFDYKDILSVTYERKWYSKSVTIKFSGRTLTISSSHIDKIESILKTRVFKR